MYMHVRRTESIDVALYSEIIGYMCPYRRAVVKTIAYVLLFAALMYWGYVCLHAGMHGLQHSNGLSNEAIISEYEEMRTAK